MTVKDIIQDLEDCIIFNRKPEKELLENTIGLIKHLQVENEKLKEFASSKCENCAGCTSWKCDCANIETYAKAEAYKECIEKVKEYIDTYEHLACEECECVPISKDGLDNLLKEMVGKQRKEDEGK